MFLEASNDFLLELEASNSFQFQSSNIPIIFNTYCIIYVYIYISMFLEASNKNLLEFGSGIGIGRLEVQKCFQLPVHITAFILEKKTAKRRERRKKKI